MRYHVHSCLMDKGCWKVEILGRLSFIILMVRDKKAEKNLIYWVYTPRKIRRILDQMLDELHDQS